KDLWTFDYYHHCCTAIVSRRRPGSTTCPARRSTKSPPEAQRIGRNERRAVWTLWSPSRHGREARRLLHMRKALTCQVVPSGAHRKMQTCSKGVELLRCGNCPT